MPWVSPVDIASAISEELTKEKPAPRSVRYVASEVLTCNQIAAIIGKEIGKPYLKWGKVSDKQMLDALKGMKVPESLAKDIVEMNAGSRNDGKLYEDYYRHEPKLGKVKVADFAKEFAAIYRSKA